MSSIAYPNGAEDIAAPHKPQVQPCRYKTGKQLGTGSYSTVRECVHIETGRYYAAKVINKRLMAGREHMVSALSTHTRPTLLAWSGVSVCACEED